EVVVGKNIVEGKTSVGSDVERILLAAAESQKPADQENSYAKFYRYLSEKVIQSERYVDPRIHYAVYRVACGIGYFGVIVAGFHFIPGKEVKPVYVNPDFRSRYLFRDFGRKPVADFKVLETDKAAVFDKKGVRPFARGFGKAQSRVIDTLP